MESNAQGDKDSKEEPDFPERKGFDFDEEEKQQSTKNNGGEEVRKGFALFHLRPFDVQRQITPFDLSLLQGSRINVLLNNHQSNNLGKEENSNQEQGNLPGMLHCPARRESFYKAMGFRSTCVYPILSR